MPSQALNGKILKMKNHMGKACMVPVGVVVFAMTGSSQEKKESLEAHKIGHFGDLKWTPIMKGM